MPSATHKRAIGGPVIALLVIAALATLVLVSGVLGPTAVPERLPDSDGSVEGEGWDLERLFPGEPGGAPGGGGSDESDVMRDRDSDGSDVTRDRGTDPGREPTPGAEAGDGRRGERGGMDWRRRSDGGARPAGPEDLARRAARRQRFMERIEIVPRGPGEVAITREDVFVAFGDVRPVMRDCMREQDLRRESWRTFRGIDRTINFDIDADGAVVFVSIGVAPPPPPALAECLSRGLEVLTTEPPGAGGVAISIDMPGRRRDAGRPSP